MIKAKLYAIVVGIFAVLLATIKILSGQNRRNKKRAERAEAKVLFQEKVVDSDTELSKDLTSRRAKISKEIKDGEVTSLSDPNSDW